MKPYLYLFFVVFIFLSTGCKSHQNPYENSSGRVSSVSESSKSSEVIYSEEFLNPFSQLVYKNECASDPRKLTHWNKGEDFPSLGLGHFIWLREGDKKERFVQSFPALVQYMVDKGVDVPLWLRAERSPWQNSFEFQKEKTQGAARMMELQNLLLSTFSYQAKHIVDKGWNTIQQYRNSSEPTIAELFRWGVRRMETSTRGLMLMLDYGNFKGFGVSEKERVAGQGWGMLQVFENMKRMAPDSEPVCSFARSAMYVLDRRIRNEVRENAASPAPRWRLGWKNRLERSSGCSI